MQLRPTILLLAAGQHRRWREHGGSGSKLDAAVAEASLMEWTLRCIGRSNTSDLPLLVVVDPAHVPLSVHDHPEVAVVPCVDAHLGIAHSMQAGIDAMPGASGAIVLLADDPLAALALPDVMAQAQREPTLPAAVTRRPAVPHPVYIPHSRVPARLDESAPDIGLRAVLRDGDVAWVETTAPSPVDVDCPADVPRLEAALHASMEESIS